MSASPLWYHCAGTLLHRESLRGEGGYTSILWVVKIILNIWLCEHSVCGGGGGCVAEKQRQTNQGVRHETRRRKREPSPWCADVTGAHCGIVVGFLLLLELQAYTCASTVPGSTAV